MKNTVDSHTMVSHINIYHTINFSLYSLPNLTSFIIKSWIIRKKETVNCTNHSIFARLSNAFYVAWGKIMWLSPIAISTWDIDPTIPMSDTCMLLVYQSKLSSQHVVYRDFEAVEQKVQVDFKRKIYNV